MEDKILGQFGGKAVGDGYPTRIVGIINVSPESFYKKTIQTSPQDILSLAKKHIEEGADVLDIGGQSTAPVSIYGDQVRVSEEVEKQRIEIALNALIDADLKIPVSIDTERASIAELGLKRGATIINDVSGLKTDSNLARVVGDYDAELVVMAAHKLPGDVYKIEKISQELQRSIDIAVKAKIDPQKIVVDPGIGSWQGRNWKFDLDIINNLEILRKLKKPLYLGISRKSFIGKILELYNLEGAPVERLYGSLGVTAICVMKRGVHILRTHDVLPTIHTTRIAEEIMKYKHPEKADP